ncbi:HIT domain-containing protein [Ignatzschineria cameli]|uniref:HIT domain-containing protein n=1 Tax=Ignatzschineria cameli TaxID=2182793 RepID=UPI000D6134E9|nr:HIT family protein [Ignatzschineria cameli]PWD85386.1 HIT family protein [Ignatzschineria cameli]
MILDEELAKNSRLVTNLPLCEVRIQNEARFPWIILVPKRDNIEEIIDLSIEDQEQLLKELRMASQVMQTQFDADKLNIGALGNIVRQLHLHVIARYETDLAWPNPVWGYFELSTQYAADALERRIKLLKDAFDKLA